MTDMVREEAGQWEANPGLQRRRPWPYRAAGVVGLVAFAVWAFVSGWIRPMTAVDLEQARLNVALAPPTADEPIIQSFRPRHDGLNQVEILLAQAGVQEEGVGTLTIRLIDASGSVIAEQRWAATQLRHNQALALRFEAQEDSQGQTYQLVLTGEGQNPFGVWAYDLDVLEGGEIAGAAAGGVPRSNGDLRFSTRYRLSAAAAVWVLGAQLARHGPTIALSLLLMLLPGCMVLLLAQRRLPKLDLGAWWSLSLALGLALWPIVWLWLTLLGGRWRAAAVGITLAAGWALALVLWVRRRGLDGPHTTDSEWSQDRRVSHILLLFLLFAALAVRLLAVRDLAFPPWVDSSRHGLITTVMVESGQAPDGYRPFLEVDEFTYHFGFHTIATGVQMLSAAPLTETLLALGQLLNALTALSVYGAAWLLTRRRDAALLAAFLVALPFFFPAYYATWGRFTQLSGALVLAPLVALTWLLVRGSRGWRRAWWVVGVLAAGLFLIHVRVFLVYLPFALLVWPASFARGSWIRASRGLAAAGALALALAGPRLWQLASGATVGSGYLGASGESYAAFPSGYVTAGWERWFLALGGVAFVGLTIAAWRRQRRALAGVVMGGWAALAALILSGRLPGVPVLWLINLNSAYILIFVPLSLLLALLFAQSWPWLRRRAALSMVGALALGAVVGASALFGMQQQITILNETTILAKAADASGLRWVDEHLPPDARIAVNSWRWLGETWAAGDGGAWIVPLTGREATTPPVDYIGDRALFGEVIAFNEGAMAIEDWAAPETAEWLAQQGVTHLFVGARGGFLDPAALARNPGLTMVYGEDGVFVFEVAKEEMARH